MLLRAFNLTAGKQRQADLCKFKGSTVYTVSFRTAELCSEALSQKPNVEVEKLNLQCGGIEDKASEDDQAQRTDAVLV